MSWPLVELSGVCDVNMGQAPKGTSYNEEGNGYALIAGAGDYGETTPEPKKHTTEPTKLSQVDDLILCIRATIGDLNWSDRVYCLGRGVAGLKPASEKLDRNYLWHFIQSNKDKLAALGTGSTFKQISRKHIEEFEIPLPPLEDQKRIAAILDKADALRCKRGKAIALTDDLLRSTFLDMFGDPITNPKGWAMRKIGDTTKSRLGKMLDAKQQTGNHPKTYLRNPNVQWNKIVLDDLKTMDFDPKDQKEFKIEYGDILVCEGGEVGRAAIWRNDMEDCFFQKALHRVRPDYSLINSEYFCDLMWFLAHFGGLGDYVTSATIAHLTGAKLKSIFIPVPPIDLQEKYKSLRNRIEANKRLLESRSNHIEDLFSSLTQRAFRGELTSQKEVA